MSERAIEKGDLVCVVRDCCGNWLGRVFVAGEFIYTPVLLCDKCNYRGENATVTLAQTAGMYCMNLPWLKRIPPLSELESTDETQKEPA